MRDERQRRGIRARQRLPGPYESMLDQVEVTVAEQPRLRLQAVGAADTVFPFFKRYSLTD
jgi:hypothetical protein